MNSRSLVGLMTSAAIAAALLSACQAQPGPAPTVNSGDGETTTATKPSKQSRQITVAVSRFAPGFNPHLISNETPLVRHISALVFPSVFVEDPAGDLVLNSDLMRSADIISGSDVAVSSNPNQPFTVRYVIAPGAQWSDGTPITGADFEYLQKAMVTEPGVSNPAGYEAISDVVVGDSGRRVDVTFSHAFSDWRSLFSNLLPSHLYRSSGDFQSILKDSVPVSGNRFTVDSIDTSRGVVTLARNDRYWGKDLAKTDRLILQAQADATSDAEMLRTGQIQAVSVRPAATTELALSTVPHSAVQVLPKDRYLTLTMNTASTLVSDATVRAQILNAVDRDSVAKIAAGRMDVAAPTDASALSGTMIPPVEGSAPALDRPLRIAVDETDDSAVAAARAVADQLITAGVAAEVYPSDTTELLESILPAGLADAFVTWQNGDSSASELASHYTCVTGKREATAPDDAAVSRFAPSPSASSSSSSAQLSSSDPSSGEEGEASGGGAGSVAEPTGESTDGAAHGANESTGTDEPSTAAGTQESGSNSESSGSSSSAASSSVPGGGAHPAARASNLSGICDPELDSLARSAQWGAQDFPRIREEVIARANALALSLALLQDSEVTAVMPVLNAPRVNGQMPVTEHGGIFANAEQWSVPDAGDDKRQ